MQPAFKLSCFKLVSALILDLCATVAASSTCSTRSFVVSLNAEFSQLEEARWYLSSTKSSSTVTYSFSMNFLSAASFILNQHFVWCGRGGFDFRLLSASPGAALEIELLSRTCLIRHTGIWSYTDEQRFAACSIYWNPELKSSFLPKRRNPPNPQRCKEWWCNFISSSLPLQSVVASEFVVVCDIGQWQGRWEHLCCSCQHGQLLCWWTPEQGVGDTSCARCNLLLYWCSGCNDPSVRASLWLGVFLMSLGGAQLDDGVFQRIFQRRSRACGRGLSICHSSVLWLGALTGWMHRALSQCWTAQCS